MLDCGSAFYARSSKRILGRVRQALGLVVSDVLNAQELEDLKQDLAVMAECNGAVVRVTLLDQNMAVETAHLMDAEDCNAAEGAGSNRQDLALCNVGAQVTLAVALQTVEGDVRRCNVAFQGAAGEVGNGAG